MIKINTITRGRFGNRILQYNSLMQIAKLSGTETSCAKWEGHDIFKDLVTQKRSPNPHVILDWRSVLACDMAALPNDNDFYIDDPAYCLHNVFYKVTKTDPREFLKIKDEYKVNLTPEKVHVGLHFRGTDILGADGNHGREIHSADYYADAISLVERKFEGTHYHVCTDDLQFDSFLKTVDFLKGRGLEFSLGSTSNFLQDFSTLSECDVLIASSSTFAICAGLIGKEDKKIIHSNKWIQRNLDHIPWNDTKCEDTRKWQISFDNFWVELYNGGNEFYKAWRIV